MTVRTTANNDITRDRAEKNLRGSRRAFGRALARKDGQKAAGYRKLIESDRAVLAQIDKNEKVRALRQEIANAKRHGQVSRLQGLQARLTALLG